MPGRSIVNQATLLQKETTPGTAATTAMKRILGLKLSPGYKGDNQPFKGGGYKVNTSIVLLDQQADVAVEGVQDFNALGFVFCSLFGPPTTTTPVNAVKARQHVWTPNAKGADGLYTYTAQWGDTMQALQVLHFVFNSLKLGIQRTQLSLDTSGLGKKPQKGITLASAGVTEVPSVPIPSKGYSVYADDTWLTLGTTKMTACYDLNLNFGEKYVPDAPIDAAVDSFQSLVEGEDIDYSGDMRLGFDSQAVAMIDTFEAGALKFFELKNTGPLIEHIESPSTDFNYLLKVDWCAQITQPGQVGKAPNSPVVTMPFDFQQMADPMSGNFAQVTLINQMTAY